MASRGPYTTIQFKIDRLEDDYCYFTFPERIRVNIKTGIIEKLMKNNPNKGQWVKAKLARSGKYSCDRLGFGRQSYSAARIIYMAFHPEDIQSSMPVQFKDANMENLKPDNLYLGAMGITRSKRAGTYNPEWSKKVEELIPNPKDRNVKNPVYMRLLNAKVGDDGLNHCQRYQLKRKQKKEALCKDI